MSNTDYQREYRRLYRQNPENKEKERANRHARIAISNDEEKAKKLAYNRKYHQEHARKSRYGITEDEFEFMLLSQNHSCAVCFTTNKGKKGWCVDHCHDTGIVRGILCTQCNTMLGHSKDKPETLRSGANYLEKFKAELVS